MVEGLEFDALNFNIILIRTVLILFDTLNFNIILIRTGLILCFFFDNRGCLVQFVLNLKKLTVQFELED